MPIRNAKLIKAMTNAPSAHVSTRKRRSTTRSRTPFRHPTRFQLSSRNRPGPTTTGKGLNGATGGYLEAIRDQSKGRALRRGSDPVNSDRVELPGKRKTMGSAGDDPGLEHRLYR